MNIKSSSKKIRATKMMSSVIAVQLAVMKILQSSPGKIPALVYFENVACHSKQAFVENGNNRS